MVKHRNRESNRGKKLNGKVKETSKIALQKYRQKKYPHTSRYIREFYDTRSLLLGDFAKLTKYIK